MESSASPENNQLNPEQDNSMIRRALMSIRENVRGDSKTFDAESFWRNSQILLEKGAFNNAHTTKAYEILRTPSTNQNWEIKRQQIFQKLEHTAKSHLQNDQQNNLSQNLEKNKQLASLLGFNIDSEKETSSIPPQSPQPEIQQQPILIKQKSKGRRISRRRMLGTTAAAVGIVMGAKTMSGLIQPLSVVASSEMTSSEPQMNTSSLTEETAPKPILDNQPPISSPSLSPSIAPTPPTKPSPELPTSPIPSPAIPNPSPTPEVTSQNETKEIEVKGDIFDLMFETLNQEAMKKRAGDSERMKVTNPELSKRGFGIFIGGLGYEQRLTNEEEFTDANMLIYINRENRSITIGNILRDTDVPKLVAIKEKLGFGSTNHHESVNQAFEVGRLEFRHKNGGPDKERERSHAFWREKDVMTEITGIDDLNLHLSIEGAIELMSNTFGKIPIKAVETIDDVQKSADGNTVYWELHVKEGETYDMDGTELVHYMQSRATTSEKNRNKRMQQVIDTAMNVGIERFQKAGKIDKALMFSKGAATLLKLQMQGKLSSDFDITSVVGGLCKNVAFSIIKGNPLTLNRPNIKKIVFDENHGLKYANQLENPQAREYYANADKTRPHLRVVDANPQDPNYINNYWKRFREAFQQLALS